MPAVNTDVLVEAAILLMYTIIAGVLTAMGAAAEYLSVQQLGSGELVAAVWLAALGAILLYAGVYGIGYQKVLVRFV